MDAAADHHVLGTAVFRRTVSDPGVDAHGAELRGVCDVLLLLLQGEEEGA